MDMQLIGLVKERLGCKLICANPEALRILKHGTTRQAFSEMVKLNGVDSQDLFDQIHDCFEEHSLGRPYHDWYHTCCVIDGVTQGLRYFLSGNLVGLSEVQQMEVNSTILAAAFHDIGHTGVKDPDIVNVSRSIIIAHRFLIDADMLSHANGTLALDLPFLLESLQSTQYPFKREPLNEYQAILRDADLLQILEPTWFDDLYINMYEEFLEGNPSLSFKEFCLNEMNFIKTTRFYSEWFREEKHATYQDTAVARVEMAYTSACATGHAKNSP